MFSFYLIFFIFLHKYAMSMILIIQDVSMSKYARKYFQEKGALKSAYKWSTVMGWETTSVLQSLKFPMMSSKYSRSLCMFLNCIIKVWYRIPTSKDQSWQLSFIWNGIKNTNFMQQNTSRGANIHSASQETPHILWILKVHYHLHKSLPLVPALRQLNPVHNFPLYYPKIHSYTNLPLYLGILSGLFRFSNKILYRFLISPMHATWPAISSSLI